jgi:hypothetical protein
MDADCCGFGCVSHAARPNIRAANDLAYSGSLSPRTSFSR